MRIISGNYKGRLIQMPRGIRPTQQKIRKAVFDILGDIAGLSFLELFAGSAAVGFEAASRGASLVVLIEQNADCAMAIRKNIESLKEQCALSLYVQDAERAVKMLHSNGKKFDIVFLDPPYYKGRVSPNPKGEVGVPLSAGNASVNRENLRRVTGFQTRGVSVVKRMLHRGSGMSPLTDRLPSAATPGANRNCAGVPLSEATPNLKGKVGVPPSAAKKTLQILEAHDILNELGIVIAQHFKKDDLPDALGVLHLFRQSKYGDTVLSFYKKLKG